MLHLHSLLVASEGPALGSESSETRGVVDRLRARSGSVHSEVTLHHVAEVMDVMCFINSKEHNVNIS